MTANTTVLLAARLECDVAQEVFGRRKVVTGGFVEPMGVATRRDKGTRVGGDRAWRSGSSHATFMGGGFRMVDSDGSPALFADGGRVGFAFFAKRRARYMAHQWAQGHALD